MTSSGRLAPSSGKLVGVAEIIVEAACSPTSGAEQGGDTPCSQPCGRRAHETWKQTASGASGRPDILRDAHVLDASYPPDGLPPPPITQRPRYLVVRATLLPAVRRPAERGWVVPKAPFSGEAITIGDRMEALYRSPPSVLRLLAAALGERARRASSRLRDRSPFGHGRGTDPRDLRTTHAVYQRPQGHRQQSTMSDVPRDDATCSACVTPCGHTRHGWCRRRRYPEATSSTPTPRPSHRHRASPRNGPSMKSSTKYHLTQCQTVDPTVNPSEHPSQANASLGIPSRGGPGGRPASGAAAGSAACHDKWVVSLARTVRLCSRDQNSPLAWSEDHPW